jgi:uroporphyrinogen decarboxylase
MAMSAKERLVTALDGGVPDRLPVTTHHLQSYFRNRYMNGMSDDEVFDEFGLDPIRWIGPHLPDPEQGDYFDPRQTSLDNPRFNRRILSKDWQIAEEEVPSKKYQTTRYTITTPKGSLTTVLQRNEYTAWVTEHLIKEKADIDLVGEYVPGPICDVTQVNQEAAQYGDRGLIRGAICGFDIYGQPGTWQDAAVLVGIQALILATFDDPAWVHQLLDILYRRKEKYVRSLAGANYDILELGGGDASTTVISPKIFRKFVAPYDAKLIALAHGAGQRIAYHTCGGMMPILEDIADMGPDAMETFTPPAMGADVDLAEAKRRIGDRVCMIGGFNQAHFFADCDPEATRAEVRRCFAEAGPGGGYILSPSDHFFDAEPTLLRAFADEARQCMYNAQTLPAI